MLLVLLLLLLLLAFAAAAVVGAAAAAASQKLCVGFGKLLCFLLGWSFFATPSCAVFGNFKRPRRVVPVGLCVGPDTGSCLFGLLRRLLEASAPGPFCHWQ